MKTWANILFGIWLVLSGLVHLGGISFSKSGIILAVLGIVTGILFFIADSSEKISTHIGSILLGVWLVAGGLVSLFHVRFHRKRRHSRGPWRGSRYHGPDHPPLSIEQEAVVRSIRLRLLYSRYL